MKATEASAKRPASKHSSAVSPARPGELDDLFAVVARYFGVLAEPARLKILNTICREERSVTMIVAATGLTQTNVSRHLSLMRAAGVVSRRKDGNTVYYRVPDSEFMEICRSVCVQIAGRIEAREPLKKDLLEFAASH